LKFGKEGMALKLEQENPQRHNKSTYLTQLGILTRENLGTDAKVARLYNTRDAYPNFVQSSDLPTSRYWYCGNNFTSKGSLHIELGQISGGTRLRSDDFARKTKFVSSSQAAQQYGFFNIVTKV
jgi:hypothetical protein